jgi:EmrB/QacA subfamily drug resistance transporter
MTNVDLHEEPASGGSGSPGSLSTPSADPRRWKALGILALVQFIIFLDATIVNVALPSIQHDLGFSASGLTWVVNGYLLAAGGLLLVGGRMADIIGRRRMFIIGAALFAVSSLTAALAQDPAMLIAARFAQGIAEAVAAPAAMSIVALLFTEPGERAKAFSIWGGLAGLGSAMGVVLSGVLTEFADWRWVFFINIPLALVPMLIAPKLIKESRMPGKRPDILSAVLVIGGLVAIIKGLLSLTDSPWSSAAVYGPIAGGVVALVLFLVIQARSANPLVPLRFFAHRTRFTANLTLIFHASASAAIFFIVVLYMQNVLSYSPLVSGLAWLPLCVLFVAGLMISMTVLPKFGAKPLLVGGLVLMAGGALLMSTIQVDSSFLLPLLPATALVGFGGGLSSPAIQTAALQDVSMDDAGLGSGVLTTVTQTGQALGLTIIVTIALASATVAQTAGKTVRVAATSGYQLAFVVATIVLAVGALAALVLMKTSKQPQAGQPEANEDSTAPEQVAEQALAD